MGLRSRARQESAFLREDVLKLVTPSRRAGFAAVIGVTLVATALSAVSPALAVGFVGVILLAYGLLFVDVDATDDTRRRWRR